MKTIASDMAKLAGSIVDGRAKRAEMKIELAGEAKSRKIRVTSELENLSKQQAEKAERDKTTRRQFVQKLNSEVDALLENFDANHKDVSARTKAVRQANVAKLKNDIHEKLDAFADELDSARDVWQSTLNGKKGRKVTVNLSNGDSALGSLTRDFASELSQRPRAAGTTRQRRRFR